ADVSFAPDVFALLLGALAASPRAALASAKTTCAPRAGLFEGIMAAPYGVDFPNLSPQLYAARVAALPPAMPEDLIEPERWLELVLGCYRIVRVPAARVAVRLPGTLPDFFRQRIRIEMGKVQLARQYPELAARGAPQPRARAALASLGPGGLVRLAAYLVLRSAAHAVAWWRYRRGATAARADLVHAQLVRAATYLPAGPAPAAVVDLVDALSASFARRAARERGPLGMIVAAEAARLLRYENELVRRGLTCLVVAESERAPLAGREAVRVVPNGVDLAAFAYV